MISDIFHIIIIIFIEREEATSLNKNNPISIRKEKRKYISVKTVAENLNNLVIGQAWYVQWRGFKVAAAAADGGLAAAAAAGSGVKCVDLLSLSLDPAICYRWLLQIVFVQIVIARAPHTCPGRRALPGRFINLIILCRAKR